MAIFKALAFIFLLPGTLVLNAINLNAAEDGGILRSFVNMIFWGIIALPFVLVFSFR